MYTRVDTDFTQEFFNDDQGERLRGGHRPERERERPGRRERDKTADFKVEGASLALVIDVTGSMGPEIGAIKTGLERDDQRRSRRSGSASRKTTIVTFDDSATVRTVSRDPDRLQQVIHGLTTHCTPDCPEGSNAALMTAGRQLGAAGGRSS